MRAVTKLLCLSGLTCSAGFAQNSDLGLLVGWSNSKAEVASGQTDTVTASGGISGQINFAFQVLGRPAGELFVELPFVASAGGNATVSSAAGGSVMTSAKTTDFLTPGVRYKIHLHSRVALYGALGVGLGSFGHDLVILNSLPGSTVIAATRTNTVALDFGGGADFRLTRLLSLRGEVRDFVTGGGPGGIDGRNHVIVQGGIGFHF